MKEDNKISIYKTRSPINRIIYSINDFFKEDIICKVEDDKIIITKPTIDYNGKTLSPSINNKQGTGYLFGIQADLPIGDFFFDEEESDEDKKTIYFNQ